MGTRELVQASFSKHGGNVSAVAREVGVTRSTVRHHIKALGLDKAKPLVGGTLRGVEAAPCELPSPGQVKRYLLTSAQNNTLLHERVWENLLALSKHYGATLLVGTYSYNRNAYGALSVKRGTKEEGYDRELWYDSRLVPYLKDERLELAPGLVWCGEMNILPTATDPLSGLETYSHRKSAIFPHAKVAMRSIAALKTEGTKINYTTGTVTQRNYVQKKAGLVAEHHHSYGGLLVEVDSRGHWWVRQLDADDKGGIQDLNVLAQGGMVTGGHRVEGITWGDLHGTTADPIIVELAVAEGGMLDALRPRYQFLHDVMEGVWINHHNWKNPHELFKAHLRGLDTVARELNETATLLSRFHRPWAQTVVVEGNHDSDWLYRWLRETDYRKDPRNAVLFLEMQLAVYKSLEEGNENFRIVQWAMDRVGCEPMTYLEADQSFKICRGKIECGQHGHLGPNGARGGPSNLSKIGRRANIGHQHTAGIYDGLYVAGTSTTLDMDYNKGPSAWTHSHVVTYPNGKRCIITMYAGRWRA